MQKIKVYPKEEEKEWFCFNYTASNFNWSDAVINGFWFFTTNIEASKQKYAGRYTKLEVMQ